MKRFERDTFSLSKRREKRSEKGRDDGPFFATATLPSPSFPFIFNGEEDYLHSSHTWHITHHNTQFSILFIFCLFNTPTSPAFFFRFLIRNFSDFGGGRLLFGEKIPLCTCAYVHSHYTDFTQEYVHSQIVYTGNILHDRRLIEKWLSISGTLIRSFHLIEMKSSDVDLETRLLS